MDIVSRWITHPAGCRDRSNNRSRMHLPNSEQAQSEACLAQTCVNSAANKRTRLLAPCQDTAQSEQRTTLDTMISLDADRLCQKRTLRARPTTLATDERLKRSHTSLCVGKGHAPGTGAGGTQRCHNGEPKDPVRRSRSTATIVGVPHGERRSNQWNEPLTTWCSRPSDSAESRCIAPEVRKLVGTTGRKSRDRRRNRRRKVRLDGKRVHERESGELRRTVAQCLDGQVPIVRQTWCPQIAENLEKPPGLAALLTWTLEETLRAVWSGIPCKLVEQGQHSMGLRNCEDEKLP